MNVSLAGTSSYLPETIVTNDFFRDGDSKPGHRMFAGVVRRRHAAKDETAVDMIAKAAPRLISDLNLNPKTDFDLILTNVSLPDQAFLGSGAAVARRLGAKPRWVFDVHNTGCVSPIYMMDLARSFFSAQGARTALICNVQNAAGNIFGQPVTRFKPQSAVPGDGCGLIYLTASDENPLLSLVHHCFEEYSEDMFIVNDDNLKYYQPRKSEMYLDFPESKIVKILFRGNRLVPDVVHEACQEAGIRSHQLDGLITNQPNPIFLRNWREALEVPAERHFDTFTEYGNLFGAGIPITLDEVLRDGRLKKGGYLALGGFSHAGDYSAAAVFRLSK